MGKMQHLKDQVGDLQATLTAKNQEIARLNILVTTVQNTRDRLAVELDEAKENLRECKVDLEESIADGSGS